MGSLNKKEPLTAAAAYVALLDRIDKSSVGLGDEIGRMQVRDAAQRLLSRMYTPFEQVLVYVWNTPMAFAVQQIFLDLGVWSRWNEGGGGEKSLDELAALCNREGVDPNLLRRLLRVLVGVGILRETAEDRYASTEYSRALGDPKTYLPQSVQCGTHHYLDSTRNFPAFLAKTGYKEPLDPAVGCNYTDAFPEKLFFWERCQTDPGLHASFIGNMAGFTAGKTPWTDLLDDTKRLFVDGVETASPLLVDVGGNVGLDIGRLLEKHPDLPAGALVLQDLPGVLVTADIDPRIVKMEHDFFQPQPVKGARGYYFHAIYHDWNDADSLKILGHTAEAMRKGYSKLLIYDSVIPATGATASMALMDVAVMHVLSAFERTEANWHSLLTEAGFVINTIWKDPRGWESLIEAELV